MKQKNEYTDVLVELEKRGVVYSVVSYFVGLEGTDIGNFMYSALISKKDKDKVYRLGFKNLNERKKVLEYPMTAKEVRRFSTVEHEYELVVNEKDCRAWEKKGSSLRAKIESESKNSRLRKKLLNLQNGK